MRPLGGAFVPGPEVDEIRWLPLERALALLSYRHDREVVRAAVSGAHHS
jgi:8-oxo-(d)GTP phosphatase